MQRLWASVLVVVIVFLSLTAFSGVKSAYGFTPLNSLTNNTPDDPTDDLQSVSRWSSLPGSLVDNGVRGLGGGIEYSVAPDFCDRMIPQFSDDPKPTCDQLMQAIRRSFDQWSSGHPYLRFVDVSGRIRAQLPPDGEPEPWKGFGAEIDILALSGGQYPAVQAYGAYTTNWYIFESPIGTNGQVLRGSTSTSADMIFTSTACFFMSVNAKSGCNHFESLVLHEIGHALSLDHPNEFPRRNFDTDDDPATGAQMDCSNLSRGFRPSANIERNAVMNSSMGQALQVRLDLTRDDIAGRDFFYPICPVTPTGIPEVINSAGSGLSLLAVGPSPICSEPAQPLAHDGDTDRSPISGFADACSSSGRAQLKSAGSGTLEGPSASGYFMIRP